MAADMMLFALLVFANMAVLGTLHVRRQRRIRTQRMMRSLRSAIERENGIDLAIPEEPRTLVLLPS